MCEMMVQRHIALVDLLLLSHELASSDQSYGAGAGATTVNASTGGGETRRSRGDVDALGDISECVGAAAGAGGECLEIVLGDCSAVLVTGRKGLFARSRVAFLQSRGLGLDMSWFGKTAVAGKGAQGNAREAGALNSETGWGRAAIDIEYLSTHPTAQASVGGVAHHSMAGRVAHVDGHATDKRVPDRGDLEGVRGLLQTIFKLARNQSQLRVSLGGGEMNSSAVAALPLVRTLIRSRRAAGVQEALSMRKKQSAEQLQPPHHDVTCVSRHHGVVQEGPLQCAGSERGSESAAALIRGLQAEKAALLQRLHFLENNGPVGAGQRDVRDDHSSEWRTEGRSPPPSPHHPPPQVTGVGNLGSKGQGEMRLRLQNASGAVVGKGWVGDAGRTESSGIAMVDGIHSNDSCSNSHQEAQPHATRHAAAHLVASAQPHAQGYLPMSLAYDGGVHQHAQTCSQYASHTAAAQVPRVFVLSGCESAALCDTM